MDITSILGIVEKENHFLLKCTNTVYNKATLLEKYNVSPIPADYNPEADYLGYFSFILNDRMGIHSISWNTYPLPGCCGGILIYDFKIIATSNLIALKLIKFMTEYMHNRMNNLSRPICVGTITSSVSYYPWAFKLCGWGTGKGSPSMKYMHTTGPFSRKKIRNIIYPIFLRLKKLKKIDFIQSIEDENALEAMTEMPEKDHQIEPESGNTFDESDYE